jgi:hypothetical protein
MSRWLGRGVHVEHATTSSLCHMSWAVSTRGHDGATTTSGSTLEAQATSLKGNPHYGSDTGTVSSPSSTREQERKRGLVQQDKNIYIYTIRTTEGHIHHVIADRTHLISPYEVS